MKFLPFGLAVSVKEPDLLPTGEEKFHHVFFCPDDRKRLKKLFEVQSVSASATENPTIICVNRLQIKHDSVDDASPAFELMNRSVFLLRGAPDSFLQPALIRSYISQKVVRGFDSPVAHLTITIAGSRAESFLNAL